jgi:hypothetical protein
MHTMKQYLVSLTRQFLFTEEKLKEDAYNFFGITEEEFDAADDKDHYCCNIAEAIAREYLDDEIYLSEIDSSDKSFNAVVNIVNEEQTNE